MIPKKIPFILLGVLLSVFSFIVSYHLYPKLGAGILGGRRAPSTNKTRVLLIGVDGASWNVMTPLLKKGKLPNIRRLMDTGSWGSLESEQPLMSEVIWTSIATGKKPGKHGIKDRLIEHPDTGELVPATSNLRKALALWQILGGLGKTAGVVGYQVTWPVERLNGVMVSNRAAGQDYSLEGYAWPEFKQLLSRQEFETIRNAVIADIAGIGRIDDAELATLMKHAKERDDFMSNFALYLMKRNRFDFMTVYLNGTDTASHRFWKYMEPGDKAVSAQERAKYGEMVDDYYIYCDAAIGGFLKLIDKDTVVMIVSDHGFKALDANYENYIFTGMDSILKVAGLSQMNIGSKTVSLKDETEDLYSSKRFIRIKGKLSVDETGRLKKDVIDALKGMKFLEASNRQVFESVKPVEGGFIVQLNLSYLMRRTDYHLIINDKEYGIGDLFKRVDISGDHARSGVIIVSGSHVRHRKLGFASIYDIAPTILCLMGLPAAEDMDGLALTEAISRAYLRKYPLKYIRSYEPDAGKGAQKPIASEMDKEIKDRMRSLGYIN